MLAAWSQNGIRGHRFAFGMVDIEVCTTTFMPNECTAGHQRRDAGEVAQRE